MQKILIIKLGALGDLVQAEGAIRDICAHHPNDEITLLTAPSYAKLFAQHPAIHRVETDTRQPRWHLWYLFCLILKLRRYGYDRVYDLQNSGRTVFYYHRLKPINWFGRATMHYCVSFQELLTKAGVPLRHTHQPQWHWLKAPVEHILDQCKITAPFILLLPGTSRAHPQKRWPYYAELAQRLRDSGHLVAWAPGPDELDLIDQFPATCLLDNGQVLSIAQIASLAPYTQLVIGNDSGPTHLLSYCCTNGVALFNNPRYRDSTRIGERYQTLCEQNLANLSVDSVLKQITVALQQTPA